MPSAQPTAAPSLWSVRWQVFAAACVRAFHAYAGWLVGISWRRFLLLSVLLMITAGILQNIPPFSWEWKRTTVLAPDDAPPELPAPPAPPAQPQGTNTPAPGSPPRPGVRIETPPKGNANNGVEITIDERGVRIVPKAKPGSPASAAGAEGAGAPAAVGSGPVPLVEIRLPDAHKNPVVREAVAEVQRAVREAAQDARQAAREAAQGAAEATRDAAQDAADAARDQAEAAREQAEALRAEARAARNAAKSQRPRVEVHHVSLGENLPGLAMLWILLSALLKVTYKRQIQAEATAAAAVETAEAEALRRQVLEARMAAMQAQVEPHFLFNTLASIDHLIEVDPPRASQMQKNLIALLRASMPTMREADGGSPRDLGRELAVIRPYLEILKVRMEERLSTQIDVPDGLLSAEFPAMMVQTLVENAIKHGLEPKPEGGHLQVKAEIVHGKLAVSVCDTGLGFGRAATAGTGVGLANIRERLQLLYGAKAALTIAENPGGGTKVTVSVPYKPLESAHP